MTATFASRAFLMRFAIFGSDETHDGRGSQTVFVMSSTRSAAPFTGTSTATGAGIVGIADVGAGVGDAVVIGKPDVDAVDGDGAAAGWVQPASVSMRTSGSASLLITFPSSGAAEWYYQTYAPRARPDYLFGGFAGQRLLPRFHPDALACSSISLRSSSLSFAIRLGFTRTRSSMTGSFSFSV